MAKSKRKRRAANKLASPQDGGLIKLDAELVPDVPAILIRDRTVVRVRSTLFNAELEWAIEIIAIERVRLAMLATRRLRLLAAPSLALPTRRLISD
jgi:hypothetical protein